MISYFCMDNFFYGLQAVIVGAIDLIRRITTYKLFWGFSLGFLTSTILHGFLLSDQPRHVVAMVLKDPATSFQKVFPADAKKTFRHSYQAYVKRVGKMKLVFSIAGILIALLLLIVLITF